MPTDPSFYVDRFTQFFCEEYRAGLEVIGNLTDTQLSRLIEVLSEVPESVADALDSGALLLMWDRAERRAIDGLYPDQTHEAISALTMVTIFQQGDIRKGLIESFIRRVDRGMQQLEFNKASALATHLQQLVANPTMIKIADHEAQILARHRKQFVLT